MEYPKPVKEALKRDLGITINEGQHRTSEDNRFVYGANCTWFGSIHDVASTGSGEDGLPCCPLCRGMLFEMPEESKWWEGADNFEKGAYPSPTARPHPGYRAMLEWQRAEKKCFPLREGGLNKLVEAYYAATGIVVNVTA